MSFIPEIRVAGGGEAFVGGSARVFSLHLRKTTADPSLRMTDGFVAPMVKDSEAEEDGFHFERDAEPLFDRELDFVCEGEDVGGGGVAAIDECERVAR